MDRNLRHRSVADSGDQATSRFFSNAAERRAGNNVITMMDTVDRCAAQIEPRILSLPPGTPPALLWSSDHWGATPSNTCAAMPWWILPLIFLDLGTGPQWLRTLLLFLFLCLLGFLLLSDFQIPKLFRFSADRQQNTDRWQYSWFSYRVGFSS